MNKARMLHACGAALIATCAAACPKPDTDTSHPAAGTGGLPPDPHQWVCPGTDRRVTTADLEQWCQAHPERGQPARILDGPQPLARLRDKNGFDFAMADFLNGLVYRQLGWWHDQTWRLTGPCVGAKEGECTESYGVHPAVRIWYSPEVADWLCSGRQGEIPDGAVIVKEMQSLKDVSIQVDDRGCMSIAGAEAVEVSSWTVMIKARSASYDGWYWAGISKDACGNPPILDRSAFVASSAPARPGDPMAGEAGCRKSCTPSDPDCNAFPAPPARPDPAWLPTGDLGGDTVSVHGKPEVKVSDTVAPYNMFGAYCLNCHGAAERESTFVTLANVVSPGMQYKWFAQEGAGRSSPADDSGSASHHERADEDVQGSASYTPPFARPLPAPDPGFLAFYDQLEPVSFSQAWALRFPAETYDHVVSGADGPAVFLSSDQCIGCHDATVSNASTPNMLFETEDGTKVNLSVYGEWRASPMGLAGRDPIFFSQLQSETNHLSELAACIEDTCLHCHGVMGQRQHAADTAGAESPCKDLFGATPPPEVPFGEPFRREMVAQWPGGSERAQERYAALARDGISCTVCHRVAPAALGTEASYTGNFVTGKASEIFGPFDDDVRAKPMEQVLGVTPVFGEQIGTSEMCESCHNILLPVFSNQGERVGFSYEQTTGLEWQNSVFAKPGAAFRSCQDCHMPTSFRGETLAFEIANIESSQFPPTDHRLPDADIALKTREPFARHALHGLNVFLNEMFQQFPLMLGLRQLDYMTGSDVTPPLITGRDSMLAMAAEETARVAVTGLERTAEGALRASVTVTNLTGHYLPSGVGFRRVFLELLVVDDQGEPLWASGRTNELGVLVAGLGDEPLPSELPLVHPGAYQPHYTRITREDQVQIYQEVVLDSAGAVTTSFLRRVKEVKDNRVRPKGYDPAFYRAASSQYIRALGELHGVEGDADYTDPARTGADRIEYVIDLDAETLARVASVQATLYSQSIPPPYLQERFRDASVGPKARDDIQRLFYLTSHLNTAAKDAGGDAFLEQWKLALARDTAPVSN